MHLDNQRTQAISGVVLQLSNPDRNQAVFKTEQVLNQCRNDFDYNKEDLETNDVNIRASKH
ncbi:2669_t:CDS:2 [Diversispora eburnea]|uniref:2669_t:CDS:1 n=1 Tax=Diversispora eburnea TaxID=1213867 RepID=A0A9N9C582_9GLOM|nr:2669_t:CDS:2 [Diversispora eburnea]